MFKKKSPQTSLLTRGDLTLFKNRTVVAQIHSNDDWNAGIARCRLLKGGCLFMSLEWCTRYHPAKHWHPDTKTTPPLFKADEEIPIRRHRRYRFLFENIRKVLSPETHILTLRAGHELILLSSRESDVAEALKLCNVTGTT